MTNGLSIFSIKFILLNSLILIQVVATIVLIGVYEFVGLTISLILCGFLAWFYYVKRQWLLLLVLIFIFLQVSLFQVTFIE